MARRIIAKDIFLRDVRRNMKDLDTYTKIYNKAYLNKISTHDIIGMLRGRGVSVKSFYFGQVEPMSLKSVLKAYNYSNKLCYYVCFPSSSSDDMRFLEIKKYDDTVEFSSTKYPSYSRIYSHKDGNYYTTKGHAFLLVTTKPLEYRKSEEPMKNISISDRIIFTCKESEELALKGDNSYRTLKIDISGKKYYISGYNLTQSKSTYITSSYSDEYKYKYVPYVDKSGYMRYIMLVDLYNRLKQYKTNKVEKLFKEQNIEEEIYSNIRDMFLQISQVHIKDVEHLAQINYLLSDELSRVIRQARDVLTNMSPSTLSDYDRYENYTKQFNEALRNVTEYKPSVSNEE